MTDDTALPNEPAPAKRSVRRPRGLRIAISSAIAVIVLLAVAGSLVYTEQSSFCPTCHEMRPYYTAWQAGGHAAHADCVDCHVDRGVIAHLAHKPVALKEVWSHFFVDYRFPNYGDQVPNSRCVNCHASVTMKSGSTFSHKKHEAEGTCQECHAATGHAVTLASLKAEGVLKDSAAMPPIPGGMSPSSIAAHKPVVCQRCHDQARMKCTSCHQALHEPKGECSNCHHPGLGFGFVHPAGTDCGSCHRAPARHFGSSCVSCHTTTIPFAKTVFEHPAGTGCSSCHKAPAKHFGPACASCHSPRVPFTETVFEHPSDSRCGSCHKPPARHFDASCASCHSPDVPFADATFTHPGLGEHSYRSFACGKCHPNGYSTSYCSCHKGRPPTD